MSKIILGMTVSLDGFINDAKASVSPLYSDFKELTKSKNFKKLQKTTGAVVMGRKSFNMAKDPDSFADSYEFQVPLFIITHHPLKKHPKENKQLTIKFVEGDLKNVIKEAKKAAGTKDVQVIGGAKIAQACLNEGLIDELHVDVMPVLLGKGIKLFSNINIESIKLTKIDAFNFNVKRVSLKYKVMRLKK